jgi:hypothetical protein
MFFADHEKTIYSPPGSDLQFDPLALDRAITAATQGKLVEWWVEWEARPGDAFTSGVLTAAEAALMSAEAEAKIAAAARVAFGLPDFPACCDATALEYLLDFRGWMAKKGRRGETPPESPGAFPAVSSAETMTSLLVST